MLCPDIKAIYEAAFVHDGVRIRVDVLERLNFGSWNLIEVKSSTEVKDVYYPDVAVQYYVLEGCGLKIGRAGILHIDNQYVYDGRNLDLESWTTLRASIRAKDNNVAFEKNLATATHLLSKQEPLP